MNKKRKLLIGAGGYLLAGAAYVGRYYRPVDYFRVGRRAGKNRRSLAADVGIDAAITVAVWPVITIDTLEEKRTNDPWTLRNF